MKTPRLAIVVPCYNEEEVLQETTRQLSEVLENLVEGGLISTDSYILFVNDGSTDNTWMMIHQYHESNKYVCGLNLAGNVGHQNALMAGMDAVADKCDVAVTIDADLQDDVDAIREMVVKYMGGCDIVYGVRRERASDTWFKRTSALAFYSLLKSMGVKSVYNHADYRLMSKRAILFLLRYRERNLFLRGMVPTIGYKTDCVYYNRTERFAGNSKYPLKKMLNFAFDGITSFSVKPVHMVLLLGGLFLCLSFCIFVWVVYSICIGRVVPGWASLMLGVVGEYIGKIYIEVKDRPRYNIEEILLHNNESPKA